MAKVLDLRMNGTTTTFTDSSASARTVTTQGDATQLPTKINKTALWFDGDSDYLKIDDHADWDIMSQTNFTISAWVKHDDHAGTETYIAQKEGASDYWSFRHIHGTGLDFTVNATAGPVITGLAGGEITDTTWHHVACIKVGNTYGLYLDGTQTAYLSDSDTDTFAGALTIGSWGAAEYLDGHMKDVFISHSNYYSATPNATPDDTITITGRPPSGSEDSNTKLLLKCDISENNKILQRCAYFDGTADCYLSVTGADSDWVFGEDPFTMDCWFFARTIGQPHPIASTYADTNAGWFFQIDTTNHLQLFADGGSSYSSTATIVANRWYHLAIVREGTGADETKLYINGYLDSTHTDATNYTSSYDLTIGNETFGSRRYPLHGYIKNLRITNGEALWTEEFVPPITSADYVASESNANVKLLMYFNADTDDVSTWTDSSSSGQTVTRNADVIHKNRISWKSGRIIDSGADSHSILPVGTVKQDFFSVRNNSVGYFDGTGDYVTVPDSSDFYFSGEDFTMAAWIKVMDDTGGCAIFSHGTNSINYMTWDIDADAELCYRFYTANTLRVTVGTGNGFITANEWFYVAVTKDDTTYTLYVNGSPEAVATSQSFAQQDWTGAFSCGCLNYVSAQSNYFEGYINDAWVDNTTEVYTAAFDPPTVGVKKKTQGIFIT